MELKLALVLKPDRACLCVPLPTRLLFAGLTLFSLLGVCDAAGTVHGLPLFLAGVCALAGLYNECWIFRPAQNLIEFHFGLLFPYRKKIYTLDSVEAFVYSEFTRGLPRSAALPGRRVHELSLRLSGGGTATLETNSGRSGAKLMRTAERLAEFCGKPLIEE